jgi:hypothetical protein
VARSGSEGSTSEKGEISVELNSVVMASLTVGLRKCHAKPALQALRLAARCGQLLAEHAPSVLGICCRLVYHRGVSDLLRDAIAPMQSLPDTYTPSPASLPT